MVEAEGRLGRGGQTGKNWDSLIEQQWKTFKKDSWAKRGYHQNGINEEKKPESKGSRI